MPSQARITPDRAVLAGMLVSAAVYCRDLQYDFILDDVPLILMNETITSWRNWATLFVSDIVSTAGAADVVAVHYRPIYMLWFMLNYKLFGMVLPWWHLTSLLLHLLAVYLTYKVGVKILREPWTAALAAVLFAFHPIHVESVSYVSASTDLLATVFLLVAFLAYARFREGGSGWYLAASVLTAALAMFSKETAAIFPLALVAYEILRERAPGSQRWGQRLVWTLPFFGVVAAYGATRTLLFGRNLGPGPSMDRFSALWDGPLVLLAYLRNLLWPARLSFFYPDQWGTEWTFGKGLALVLVLVAAVFLWNRYREHPGRRLLFLWTAILFFIPVVTVSALRTQDWIHDRHMYLVSVPFCLLAAAVLTDLKIPRRVSMLASSLVAVTLLVVTAVQVPKFKDELTVYGSALKVAPHNVLLRRRYVAALWNSVPQVREPSARREEALREFVVNIELWPELELSYENYGAALAQIGREEEAAAQYRKALQLDGGGPTHFRASILYRLAGLDVKLSKLEEAERCLREAVAIDPRAMSYHALLAQVLERQGHSQEAHDQMKLEAAVREQFIRQHSALSIR